MNRVEASRILGVEPNDSLENIKKAYKKKSLKYHPDKNVSKPKKQQEDAENKFKEISQAYQTLTKPQNQFNDNFSRGPGFGMEDPFELFNQIFGESRMGGGGNQFESVFADNNFERMFSSGFSSSFSSGFSSSSSSSLIEP